MAMTASVTSLTLHDLAKVMPPMTDEERAALIADIKERGILEPLWITGDNRILDGRHRWEAAKKLKLPEVPVRRWKGGDKEAIDIITALNLKRRHLTPSQLAIVGARLAPLYEDAAKERQHAGKSTDGQAGGRGRKNPSAKLRQGNRKASAEAAAKVGTSPRSVEYGRIVVKEGTPELAAAVESKQVAVAVAAKIAKLPAEEQIAILETSGDTKQALRIHERTKRLSSVVEANKPLPVGEKKYSVIYADPPWLYECNTKNDRAVDGHYPTMTLDEICALPVSQLAADPCVLFLWTTAPKVMEAGRVIEAWGFRYATCAVWDKQKIGIGSYFRIQHELLLVATRGDDITPPENTRVSSVLSYPRRKHSEKPTEVYEILETMYPTAARIELFARTRREGWATWGNQA